MNNEADQATPKSDTPNTPNAGMPNTPGMMRQPDKPLPPRSNADMPTTTPFSSPSSAPKPSQPVVESSGKNRRGMLIVVVLIVALLAAAGAATWFFTRANALQDDKDSLEAKVATLDADFHELPEGAIKVSECVPNMGFHYLAQDGDPRLGPFYLVNKQGDVIGVEYMFNNDMMSALEIPDEVFAETGEEPFPVEVLTTGPENLSDWQFKNVEIGRSPEGHPGFEEDHMDIHLYTVTPEVQAQSCQ